MKVPAWRPDGISVLEDRPFLCPLASRIASLPLISQGAKKNLVGRRQHSVLSDLKGFGPGDNRLGRQRTLHALALLRLVVFRLFLMPPLPGKSKCDFLRESAPVSSLNTRIPVCMVCDHLGGGQSRRSALYRRC